MSVRTIEECMSYRFLVSRVPSFVRAASTVAVLGALSACGGSSSSPTLKAVETAGDLLNLQNVVVGNTYTNTSSVQKIRYRMKAVNGGLTEANAILMLPKGAKRGGWPLVVWAHGTVGVADACAPSRTVFGDDKEGLNLC